MKLQVNNIHKSFGTKHVLKGISFEATSGRAIGLLGRNGAGKTTTIRIIMDVFKGEEGTVLIDDQDIDYSKIRIGYLPEERGLYPKKKIIEQIVYLAELKGMKKKEAIKSADYWLERLGMQEYRNKPLETLSKGNQQKIQLIATITPDPEVVILDEPFSGLDPVNSILLKEVVEELIQKGKIVIFSSHQMNYIEEFCDDIVIIKDGEIVLSGSIKDIILSYPRDCIKISSPQRKQILGIKEYNTTTEDEYVYIHLTKEQVAKEVMSHICTEYEVDSIQIKEPTLNEIFVEYATKGENDETI